MQKESPLSFFQGLQNRIQKIRGIPNRYNRERGIECHSVGPRECPGVAEFLTRCRELPKYVGDPMVLMMGIGETPAL
jgi:hypothetical protein